MLKLIANKAAAVKSTASYSERRRLPCKENSLSTFPFPLTPVFLRIIRGPAG